MSEKLLFTIAEIAAESGLSTDMLYRLVATGDLAAIRLSNGPANKYRTHGRIRIQRADWDDWVRRHRTPATVERPRVKTPGRTLDLPGADLFLH